MKSKHKMNLFKEETRGPNFATFHCRHVSDLSEDTDTGQEEVSRGLEQVNRGLDEVSRGLEEVSKGQEEVSRGQRRREESNRSFICWNRPEDNKKTLWDSEAHQNVLWGVEDRRSVLWGREDRSVPSRNQSDDEDTKKRTPRFDKAESSSKLQPERKLTYSAEDVKRLASEAEILVLRRKRIGKSSDSDGDRRKREWRKSLPCRLELMPRGGYRSGHGRMGGGLENFNRMEQGDKESMSTRMDMSTSMNMSTSSDSFYGSSGDLQSKIEESSSTEALITGVEAENNPETTEHRNLNLNLNLDQDMSRTRDSNKDPTKTDEIGLEENWFKNLNLEQIKVETGDWNSDSEFGDSVSTCSSSSSGYTRGKDGSRREEGSNHSSSESQLWDKEDYLSEYQYEENVDEEGIRTILSLGEDYSGLKDDYTLLAEDEFKLQKSEMDEDYSLKCMDDYLLCDEDYSQCMKREDDLSSSPEDVKDDINDEDLNDSGINLISPVNTQKCYASKSPRKEWKSGKCLKTGNEERENAKNSSEISQLKSRIDSVKFALKQIIHSSRDGVAPEKSFQHENNKINKCELLFQLKRDVFDLNLWVHKLETEENTLNPSTPTSNLREIKQEVVDLYALLRKAKHASSEDDREDKVPVKPRRRRIKKRTSIKDPEVQRIEDSGYSDTFSEPKVGLGPGVGLEAGGRTTWGRIGRFCLYSCFLVAALLPLAVYSQARCCENLNYHSSWVQLSYVNGPPPI